MAERLRVRRLSEADADSLAEFVRAVGWDPAATPERVRETFRTAAAENPFEPGAAPPTVGVFVGTRLIAHVTSIPTRFWNGRKFAPAHWLKGFWVLEQYRNGPIGYLLLKEMLKHVGVAASLPAAPVPRRLSAALGMLDLGAVCNYIHPLRPTHILRKVDFAGLELNRGSAAFSIAVKAARTPPLAQAIGALVTLGMATLRLPDAWAARGLTTKVGDLPDEASLDDLWARAQRTLSSLAMRSGAYLRWRYERGANGHYAFASVWRGSSLVGLGVLAPPTRPDDPRIAGLGIGSVVDLVLDPDCPGALRSVLGAARRWAKSANYGALLLTASSRALRGPLLRAGYLPMPGNIHLMLRDPDAKHGLSTDLDAWMITRGDAWTDHV
jgi:GNAT superfamily N-acetyltransferase